MGGYRQHCL